ncbi:SusC/RagA family TonB-linked outer membrane protein [Longimonas halophila]|nr:TonB-dependent receptor [Longimonas halophila]
MIACLFLWVGTASAQDSQEITGTVTDASNGEPLPGANVTVVGEPIGTATNVDGEYALDVPSSAEMLRFSFIGYEAQEVPIEGRTTIDVALTSDASSLDEVVVIGYGTQEERDVTGAVESVRTEDFNQAPVVSPENLISGKVAGVQISSGDGSPGGGNLVRIRGENSFSAGNDPLYVIDGVPIDNGGNRAQRNPLNFLNPNDIASMTVLKDASATAIYGSRGANGVILIETKQAGEDEGRITYDGSVSTSVINDRVSMMGAEEYRNVVRNDGPSQAINQLGRTSTDWQDLVERQSFGQEHSVSFARGYEDSDFRLSLGYLDQEGTLQGSSTERISLSFNYNQQFLDDALSITANLRGSQTQDQFEPGGMVGNAASFNPTVPVRDFDSPYGGFFEWGESLAEKNPLAQLVLAENEGQARRSLGNVEAEYRIPFVEGLSARLNVGYDVQEGEQVFFAPTNLKEEADQGEDAGTVQRANFTRTNSLLDAYLTYDNEFEEIDSRFDITAGYSYQDFVSKFPEFTAFSLDNNIFGGSSTGPASESQTFVDVVPNRLISGFGRINYTFADRYLATFTVRRDGSSRFGPAEQWGTFPSAALGWRVNEEPFMDDVDFLSSLRLRLSWGITGNQEIGNFGFEPLYTPGDAQSQVQFGNSFITTLRPSAADEGLKWEEKTTYNAGINFGLFDERFSGSVEVYREDTDDLLRIIPVAAGANLRNRLLTNIGEVRNQGVETSLSLSIFRGGDFTWDANFNAAYNENEVLKVSNDDNFEGILTGGIAGATGNNVQILREGESLGTFFLYEQSYDENGDPIFTDPNDTEAYGELLNSRRPVGNASPDWVLGHTSQFAYQNFDASVSLRAHIGNDVYNNNASNFGHLGRLSDIVASNIHTSYNETGFTQPQYFSDIYLEDGSFLRLDNVSVGYTVRQIPGVNQLRVYGTASNLLTITGYDGPDPEVNGGIDNNLYPRSRSFTAGVNLQF